MLSPDQIKTLLQENDFQDVKEVELVKTYNHIYRITISAEDAYLKIYTKDWYGEDVAGTAYCVDHECAAWETLSAHGLAAPQILLADTTIDNALHRPFLLTKRLQGQSLTELLIRADASEQRELLLAVGRYMAAMHQIPFSYPGYITSTTPTAPLDPTQWQHPIWTFDAFEREAQQTLASDRMSTPDAIMNAVEAFYSVHAPELKQVYAIPHFAHGDCHASQFFLYKSDSGWQVSGVVDMEVTSAGDSGNDLVKFAIEMASLLPAESRWWEPVFEGYGAEPSFNLIKLRMLAAHHGSYGWIWPGSRQDIVQHILAAENWHQLFDLEWLK